MIINRKTDKGFTLLEVVLVLLIAGFVMLMKFQQKQNEFMQMNARELGVEIYTIANGVSNFVAYKQGDGTYPGGSYSTLDFLRDADDNPSTTCETSERSFIHCHFLEDNRTNFGNLRFTIDVSQSATASGSDAKLTSKIVFDPLELSNSAGVYKNAASLSGIAVMIANGAASVNTLDPTIFSNVAEVIHCFSDIVPKCEPGDVGSIIALIDTSSATEKWLRVDNGNTMQDILEFGNNVSSQDSNGFSRRQIKNVARIYNDVMTGSVNDALILGNDGSFTSSSALSGDYANVGVVADSDMLAYKNFYVRNSMKVAQDLLVDGNMKITEDLTVEGDTYLNGELQVEGDAYFRSNVTVDENMTTKNAIVEERTETDTLRVFDESTLIGDVRMFDDLAVYGDATIEGTFRTSRIYDLDDPSYFVDPNNHSILKSVEITNTAVLPFDTKIKSSSGTDYRLRDLIPAYVNWDNKIVNNGGTINVPNCPNYMEPKIIVIPQQVETSVDSWAGGDGKAAFARGGWYANAIKTGGVYRIYIRSMQNASGYVTGKAIARTYCQANFQ